MGSETNSLIDVEHHDNEWAVLVHDDNNLFEFLLLQSAQVGLSRSSLQEEFTILTFKKSCNIMKKLFTYSSVIRN